MVGEMLFPVKIAVKFGGGDLIPIVKTMFLFSHSVILSAALVSGVFLPFVSRVLAKYCSKCRTLVTFHKNHDFVIFALQ